MNHFYTWIRRTFLRLVFAFHWVGLLCLLFWAFFLPYGLYNEVCVGLGCNPEVTVWMVLESLFEAMFEQVDLPQIQIAWIAIVHWPIKWLLTGNTSFVPLLSVDYGRPPNG